MLRASHTSGDNLPGFAARLRRAAGSFDETELEAILASLRGASA